MKAKIYDEDKLRTEAYYLAYYLGASRPENIPRLYNDLLEKKRREGYAIDQAYVDLINIPNLMYVASRPLGTPTGPGGVFLSTSKDIQVFTTQNIWNISMQPTLLEYILSYTGSLFIPIGMESESGGHANLLQIYVHPFTSSALQVDIRRFEPYFGDPKQSQPEFYTNTDVSGVINQVIREGLQNALQSRVSGRVVNVTYYNIVDYIPLVGPQVVEEYRGRLNEEARGYCVFWSLAFLDSVLDEFHFTGQIDDISQVIRRFIYRIAEHQGVESPIPPENLRSFIQNYAGEYLYERFREELMRTPPVVHRERAEILWKYIQKTVRYSDIFGEILQDYPRREFAQLPQISITRYILSNKPEFQTIQPGFMLSQPNQLLVRFATDPEYIYEVTGVDNISGIDGVLAGILVLTDEEIYQTHDVEHINVLILNPDIDRGVKRTTFRGIEVARFEPSYGSRSRMTNMDPSTEWNQALMISLKKRLSVLIGKPQDVVRYTPELFSSCPLGPQTLEFRQAREEGEHFGYCQNWAFEFARRMLEFSIIKNGSEVEWLSGFPRLGRVTGFDMDNSNTAIVELQIDRGQETVEKRIPVSQLYLRPSSIREIMRTVLESIYIDATVSPEDVADPALHDQNMVRLYNYIKKRAREVALLVIERFYIPHFQRQLMS